MKNSDLAADLKKKFTPCRVSFEWLGTRKTFTAVERQEAASQFAASAKEISASKKLFDTRHPAFAKVTTIKNNAVNYWRAVTLPYVEDGVRLLKKENIDDFNDKMGQYQADFEIAIQDLDNCLPELKDRAKTKLGKLYDESYYPKSVKDHFSMEWDFPSVEPPDHLKELAPNIYAQEAKKIQDRLEEAVSLAQAAFLQEFKTLVSHIHEKLVPDPDGKKKIFKDSTITNLVVFFDKFKQLHQGGAEELESLVDEAKGLLKGISPEELRDSEELRKQIASEIGAIANKLDPLVAKASRRKIIVAKKEAANVAA